MQKKEKINANELSNQIFQQLRNERDKLENTGINVTNKVIIGSFEYSETIPLTLRNCLFVNEFGLYDCKLKKRIFFKDCYFLKGINISGLKLEEDFIFNNCRVRGEFMLEGELNNFTIISSYIDNWQINIKANSIRTRLGNESSYFKTLNIYFNDVKENIHLNNCVIGNLSFGYMNITSPIEIFNCQISTLEFLGIKNITSLRILNCKAFRIKDKKSRFQLIESNLGTCEFFQFDFASYDELNIINSVLINCLFINCSWTNNIKSYYPNSRYDDLEQSKTSSLKSEREVYKQIKYALSRQGDIINEHLFHGFEMNAYNKSLSLKYFKNWATKVILSLSYFTSNYGQSLWRPFGTLIIINGILFSVLNISLNFQLIPLPSVHLLNIIYSAARFIWFMNPLHRNDPELQGISLIIDIIMRVISSYCLYNIIRASRRFIK